MKTTTIDASLMPKVWLEWKTTKARFYLDCATGEKYTKTPECLTMAIRDNTAVVVSSNSKPRFAYAKYHEDIEMLELAEVTIDTTRKAEPKAWRYSGNKYFLGKDKVVVDENGNVCNQNFYMSQYHVGANFKGFLSLYNRLNNKMQSPVKEFKKFLGNSTYTVGSGRTAIVRSPWNIEEWYCTKQKVKGPGREQKRVDKLVSMPLSDVSNLGEKYPIKTIQINSYYKRELNGIMYYERLTDGWSVIRMFNRSSSDPTPREHERMYLHDGGANRITSLSGDNWIPAKSAYDYWLRYQFVNIEEAMEKCNRLKYILPMFNESDHDIHRCIINTLRFPEIEQFAKLGYNDFAMRIANTNTPKAEVKNEFMYYNDKTTNLLKKVGLNKHQLDTCLSYTKRRYGYTYKVLELMREMFGETLNHMNNATFDEYFNEINAICNQSWGRPFKNLAYVRDVDKGKFIKNAIRLGKKNPDIYGAINDTINQYVNLNVGTHPEINWYFDSCSDVIRAHDAIGELKRAQDAERRAMYDLAAAERMKKEEEKRKKTDEERKKYEYEDENFIIRLPNNGNEIIREGNIQHICIGGYVTRHATGGTNLFFIRRKNAPEVPFYAIEMNNHKQIIQIHGAYNKWLGNNPEVIPTVVRWLRKNEIQCDKRILTCTSTGYGSNGNYIPMPVVD